MTLKKIAILLLTFTALFWILKTPLVRFGRLDPLPEEQAQLGDAVSVGEMRKFLKTWSAFVHNDIGRYGVAQVSLSGGRPSETYPPRIIRWFRNQGWDIDRFFYVEQRLKAAVKTAGQMKHLDANRDFLKQMRHRGESGAKIENMQNIIRQQERQLNAEKITPEELQMVRDNLYRINAVLEGKDAGHP